MVNEAALLAARRNRKKVVMQDFQDSKDKVMLGMERKSLVMTEDERRNTAYHEAGHALVAWLMPGSEPVDKVTIIPRGRALGLTLYLPHEERYSRTREDLDPLDHHGDGRTCGRAAGVRTSHHRRGQRSRARHHPRAPHGVRARHEREAGTADASARRRRWSSSARRSPPTRTTARRRRSRSTAEVRQIAETCYQHAFQLLKDNVDRLHLLAKTLLEREVLDGDEMNRVLRGEKLEPPTPVEPPSAHPVVTEVVEERPSGIEAFTPPPRPRPAGA